MPAYIYASLHIYAIYASLRICQPTYMPAYIYMPGKDVVGEPQTMLERVGKILAMMRGSTVMQGGGGGERGSGECLRVGGREVGAGWGRLAPSWRVVEMLTKSLLFGMWPDADFPPHSFPLKAKRGRRQWWWGGVPGREGCVSHVVEWLLTECDRRAEGGEAIGDLIFKSGHARGEAMGDVAIESGHARGSVSGRAADSIVSAAAMPVGGRVNIELAFEALRRLWAGMCVCMCLCVLVCVCAYQIFNALWIVV